MSKNLARYIAATNKKFDAASPEQKRIMIAKDVILRINQENFKAIRGIAVGWIQINDEETELSFKTFINNNDKEGCRVCAKGAMFCAVIGRVNKMSLGEMNLSNSFIVNKGLEKYFSLSQIDLMETAFEGKTYMVKADVNELLRALNFYKRYEGYEANTNRLIAICKNIIDNNGTFIP